MNYIWQPGTFGFSILRVKKEWKNTWGGRWEFQIGDRLYLTKGAERRKLDKGRKNKARRIAAQKAQDAKQRALTAEFYAKKYPKA